MFKINKKDVFSVSMVVIFSLFFIVGAFVAAKEINILGTNADSLIIKGQTMIGGHEAGAAALTIDTTSLPAVVTTAIDAGSSAITTTYSALRNEDVITLGYLNSVNNQVAAADVSPGIFGANGGTGGYVFPASLLVKGAEYINFTDIPPVCNSSDRLKVNGTILAKQLELSDIRESQCTPSSFINWTGTEMTFTDASNYIFDNVVKSSTGFAVGLTNGYSVSLSQNSIATGLLMNGGLVVGFSSAVEGLTTTVNLTGNGGSPCRMTFEKGILVSENCP